MLRVQDLLIKAKGENLVIETDFGPASAIDVFGKKLVVFCPEKITINDLLDFLDQSKIEGEFDDEEIEMTLNALGFTNEMLERVIETRKKECESD